MFPLINTSTKVYIDNEIPNFCYLFSFDKTALMTKALFKLLHLNFQLLFTYLAALLTF